MPVAPSPIQSHSTARRYTLKGGREVYVSNGCIVDLATKTTLAWSNDAAMYLLKNARLSDSDRDWLETWGDLAFRRARGTTVSRNEIARMNA